MAFVLIIDPDLARAAALARGVQFVTRRSQGHSDHLYVSLQSDFSRAREQLRAKPPDLLVTALALREYNGLHLVYLAAAAGLPTRSIVYTDMIDPFQTRAIQAAGAFHEVRPRLPVTLPAYISAALPPNDRRNGICYDRRHLARGGRRAADQLSAL